MPLVSVIIPTFNRAAYLPATLDSVLAQRFRDFEIVVVDDGSTDETQAALAPYRHRLHYYWQANQREGAARNHGINRSSGEFLAFLDSDDLWLPDKLALDVAALQGAPEAGLVYSRVEYISDTGQPLGSRRFPTPAGDVFHRLIYENFITLSSVTVRRSALEAVGLFNPDPVLSGSIDWEAWVRLAARYPFVYVPRTTTQVRVHPRNMLSDGSHMERAMLRAGALILENPDLATRLRGHQRRFRAQLYLAIAVNHASTGAMHRARRFLAAAVRTRPAIVGQPAFGLALARVLLGWRLTSSLKSARRLARSAPSWRRAAE